MRTICLAFGMLVACGGTQAKTTITTQQDFDTTVNQLIDEAIEVFKADGINCELVNRDLKEIGRSGKFKAAQEWASGHPDAKASAKKAIADRQKDLDTASAPASHQCDVHVEITLNKLTSDSAVGPE